MPYNSSGVIYVDTTVTPNRGVSIDDVRSVLGLDSRDVGTLCSSSNNNVNKWAKHKPIVYANAIAPLTEPQFKEKNYGLTVPPNPLADGYTKIDDVISNVENAYSYTKPSGDMASPFRLSDFNKYSHSAKAPINGFPTTIKIVSSAPTYTLYLSINQSSDYDIGLTDLPSSFGSWYLGFAVKNGSNWSIKTSRFPINNSKGNYILLNFGNSTVDRDGESYSAGVDNMVIVESRTYDCCIVLCSRKIEDFWTLSSSQSTYKFHPAPVQNLEAMKGTISRSAAAATVALEANVVTAAGGLFVSATIQIRFGHGADSYHSGDVNFNLTLTGTNSTDPSLDGKIYENATYVNSITWNQAKTSCTLVGTIAGPFDFENNDFIIIPKNNGALFRTTTQKLTISGTVRTDWGTINVYSDGDGWVVNQQE